MAAQAIRRVDRATKAVSVVAVQPSSPGVESEDFHFNSKSGRY